MAHPLLNIYFVKYDELSKKTRAAIFILRTLLILAFSSLFNDTGADDVREREQEYKFVVKFKFFYSFNFIKKKAPKF